MGQLVPLQNGFQCNFEMAMHKLKVHYLSVLQATDRVTKTPPQDKGRYGKFKDKLNKAGLYNPVDKIAAVESRLTQRQVECS
jgi:hypothetical protein